MPHLKRITLLLSLTFFVVLFCGQFRRPRLHAGSPQMRETKIGWPFAGYLHLELSLAGASGGRRTGTGKAYATAERLFYGEAIAINAAVMLVFTGLTGFTIEYWARRTNSFAHISLALMLLSMAIIPASIFLHARFETLSRQLLEASFGKGLVYEPASIWLTPLVVIGISSTVFTIGWAILESSRWVAKHIEERRTGP